jgi:hypothetical protein
MIQPVLPLHKCAAESVAEPAATESIADPVTAESAAEPLHFVADPAAAGTAPTEISCLCVQV